MSTLRKIENEAEARACLSAIARAGTDIKSWSRARGIDGRSLHAWKMNLSRDEPRPRRGRARAAASVGIVELVPASVARSTRRYLVTIGAVSVELGDDFDEGTLRRIVEVLRAC